MEPALPRFNNESRAAEYIPTLDGWRAVAVAAVILFHGNPSGTSLLTDRGGLGVKVFFSISGFLITARLLSEWQAMKRINLKAFYLRRFFRIVAPAYLFLVVLMVLSSQEVISLFPGEIWASLLFVRNFAGGTPTGAWSTGHLWSLGVEEQFYLTWPWIMLLGPARAQGAALVLAFAIHLWRLFTEFTQPAMPEGLAYPWFDYMMWGCWWALLLRSEKYRAAARRVLTFPVWLVLALLLSVMVSVGPTRFVFAIGFVISTVVVGTVLRPEQPVSRLLETAPLRWVGRISYGLYLWQQLFFVAVRGAPRGMAQTFPVNLILLFAIVVPIYYGFERPMVSLGHRLTSSKIPSLPAKESP